MLKLVFELFDFFIYVFVVEFGDIWGDGNKICEF